MLDAFLGGLPVHCWEEVMEHAELPSRPFEHELSPAEFTRVMGVSELGVRVFGVK